MYEDIPFDVFEDPDMNEDPFASLYKEGSQGRPIDATTANYYVGRIKQDKEKMKQYDEQAKQMKDDFKVRVDTWLQSRQKTLDADIQHCMDMLEIYYAQNPPANGKSISLPEGNIGMYAVSAKYDFDTKEKQILDILRTNPELQQYVRTKEEIDRARIRKDITIVDGEVCVGEHKIPFPEIGYTPKTTAFGIR